MKRWTLLLLLLLLPFTMAPRTSEMLENDWEAAVMTDGSRGSTTGTFVAHVWPGPDAQSTQAAFTITVGGPDTWRLVAASHGCEAVSAGGVRTISCVVDAAGGKPHTVLRVTVRTMTGNPPAFVLSAADLS